MGWSGMGMLRFSTRGDGDSPESRRGRDPSPRVQITRVRDAARDVCASATIVAGLASILRAPKGEIVDRVQAIGNRRRPPPRTTRALCSSRVSPNLSVQTPRR